MFDGGDDVRESALDIYERSRNTFVKSLLDGIGTLDAAAEYYFASLNYTRHGSTIPLHDYPLQKMIWPIVKEEEPEPIPYPCTDEPAMGREGESAGGWSPGSAIGGGGYGVNRLEEQSGAGHSGLEILIAKKVPVGVR